MQRLIGDCFIVCWIF